MNSVALALAAALSIALLAAFGKALTGLASFNIVLFVRFFMPCLLVLLYLCIRRQALVNLQWRANIGRSIFLMASQYCFFFVIMQQNLLLAILLISTTSFFNIIIARIFLATPISIKTSIAILLSFAGIIIVIGPTVGLWSWTTLLGLLSGLFNACAQITLFYTARQQRQDPVISVFVVSTIASVIALLLLPLSAVYMPLHYTALMHGSALLILLLATIFGLAHQILRGKAYALVSNPSHLSPFINCSIIFSGVIDWLWLGIVPAWHTYVGVSLIIVAATYAASTKE